MKSALEIAKERLEKQGDFSYPDILIAERLVELQRTSDKDACYINDLRNCLREATRLLTLAVSDVSDGRAMEIAAWKEKYKNL